MKLIIDIPEDIYDMVMNTNTFGKYRFNTTKAIKNGTPFDSVIEDVKAKREKGEWIYHPEKEFICCEHWECSRCHKSTMTNPIYKDNDYDNMYFCPNCGADMRGNNK